MKYLFAGLDDTHCCLECGKEIKYGRADKKFCSGDCKNMYHNKDRRKKEIAFMRVQSTLKKNYSLLKWLLVCGRTMASMDELCEKGFDPMFYTECTKIGRRREFVCFDISYMMSENKLFKVRRRDFNKAVNGYICRKT